MSSSVREVKRSDGRGVGTPTLRERPRVPCPQTRSRNEGPFAVVTRHGGTVSSHRSRRHETQRAGEESEKPEEERGDWRNFYPLTLQGIEDPDRGPAYPHVRGSSPGPLLGPGVPFRSGILVDTT